MMERRRYPRFAVNLNAAVVNDRALPIGCRVRDVSSSGIALRHEGHGATSPFHRDDHVQVRVSLKEKDERKVIQLPMTVVRNEKNDIGGEFEEPQPRLVKLIEPYRVAAERKRRAVEPTSNRAGKRETGVAAGGPDPLPDIKLDPDERARAVLREDDRFRGPLIAGLTVIGITVCGLSYVALDLGRRIQVLESGVQPDEVLRRTESVASRTEALEARIADLEATRRIATPVVEPVSTPDGEWVVNLVTLQDGAAAFDFTEQARAQGIDAKVLPETIGARRVWRIQVVGFPSREAASLYSVDARRKLGLDSVWIYERDE